MSGVSFAGLTMLVQPAAIAGASLRAPIASGKFHGVMKRQGPTGWRRTSVRPLPSAPVLYSPARRCGSPANHQKKLAP